jgi:hypothetical protein
LVITTQTRALLLLIVFSGDQLLLKLRKPWQPAPSLAEFPAGSLLAFKIEEALAGDFATPVSLSWQMTFCFPVVFKYQNDHFAKTGSEQTYVRQKS